MKWVYFILGWICLAIAAAGFALPGLPGTPFVLLAAACFARSSPRFHQWLRNHPQLGGMVRDWEDHGAISRSGKHWATMAIVVSLLTSTLLLQPQLWVVLLLAGLGVALIWFIQTRPDA